MTDLTTPYVKEIQNLRHFLKQPIADIGGGDGDIASIMEAVNIDKHENADVKCDFEKQIPLADDFFNSGYCLHVIEHIKNLDKFFLEIKRIIKKEGFIIFITPNGHAFDGLGHIHYWNLEEIQKILVKYFLIYDAYELESDKGNLVIICRAFK